MYLCNRCAGTGKVPGKERGEDGVYAEICRSCGSDDLRISTVSCSVCGEPLFEGDSAFRVKDMIICPGCATEITV